MGSLVFDKCYPSIATAADAFFSAKEPVLTPDSVTWFEKDSVWAIKRQTIAQDGTVTNLSTTEATLPAFPECDHLQPFNDGTQLGWLIAIVMLAAWGMNMVRRQIR
jgi:hypothetical protein